MNEALNQSLPKSKQAAFSRKLDLLLSRLKENNQAAKETYKEIDKLKRSNDRSFSRAKKAVETLETY